MFDAQRYRYKGSGYSGTVKRQDGTDLLSVDYDILGGIEQAFDDVYRVNLVDERDGSVAYVAEIEGLGKDGLLDDIDIRVWIRRAEDGERVVAAETLDSGAVTDVGISDGNGRKYGIITSSSLAGNVIGSSVISTGLSMYEVGHKGDEDHVMVTAESDITDFGDDDLDVAQGVDPERAVLGMVAASMALQSHATRNNNHT